MYNKSCLFYIVTAMLISVVIPQVILICVKLNGSDISWAWVLSPIWIALLLLYGVPVLFSIVNKLIKFIKNVKNK